MHFATTKNTFPPFLTTKQMRPDRKMGGGINPKGQHDSKEKVTPFPGNHQIGCVTLYIQCTPGMLAPPRPAGKQAAPPREKQA